MAQPDAQAFAPALKGLLTLSILLMLAVNWLPAADRLAQTYLSETIASNAIVFGVVRSLNGVISVVQSAEIGVGVAGITIGEIFDPVNDLIERFSSLLLVTLTALGIQQVLLIFTGSVVLKIFFSVCMVATLVWLWWPNQRPVTALRLVLILILLRFLLSLQVALVWLFDWLYFDATGAEALSILQATTEVIDNLRDTLANIDLSAMIFGTSAPNLPAEDIGARISGSVVTLIVGMLFKSILIPVATLWLGYKASAQLLRSPR